MGEMEAIFAAWDELDSAAKGVLTAQPFQMTAKAERLEEARKAMGDAVRALWRASILADRMRGKE